MVVDQSGRARPLSTGLVRCRVARLVAGWRAKSGSRPRERAPVLSLWAVTSSGRLRPLAETPGSSLIQRRFTGGGRVLLNHGILARVHIGRPAPANRRSGTSRGSTSPGRPTSRTTGRRFSSRSGAKGAGHEGRRVSAADGRLAAAAPAGRVSRSSLSPDGQWVISRLYTSPPRLVLLPTGAGEAKPIPTEGILVQASDVVPGREAHPPARRARRTASSAYYALDIRGGAARPDRAGRGRLLQSLRARISPDGRLASANRQRRTSSSCFRSTGVSRARSPAPSRARSHPLDRGRAASSSSARRDGARRTDLARRSDHRAARGLEGVPHLDRPGRPEIRRRTFRISRLTGSWRASGDTKGLPTSSTSSRG